MSFTDLYTQIVFKHRQFYIHGQSISETCGLNKKVCLVKVYLLLEKFQKSTNNYNMVKLRVP